jgi:hypothetical protein
MTDELSLVGKTASSAMIIVLSSSADRGEEVRIS